MPEEFIVKHDVPIMDVHTKLGRPKPFDNMDEALLYQIVEVNNHRMADTGDEIPIVGYHTNRDAPGDEQPPIIGYAKDLYVGKFGKLNPRACIFVKEWKIFKKYKGFANDRPRRSIELSPRTLKIDPIALLGAIAPERHLGQLIYSLRGSETVHVLAPLQYGKDETMALTNEDFQEFMNMFLETPLGKKMIAMVGADEGSEHMEHEEMPGQMPSQMPGQMPGPPPNIAQGFKHEEEEMPGPGGTHEPGRMPEPEEEKMHAGRYSSDAEKLRMQNDEEKIKYRALEEQVASEKSRSRQLESEVSTISRELRRAKYERSLTQLGAEGIQFSRPKELDRLQDLNEGEFENEIQRMRECYKSAPINIRYHESEAFMRDGGEESTPMQFTQEEAQKAVKYAREAMQKDGLTYEVAYEAALKQDILLAFT